MNKVLIMIVIVLFIVFLILKLTSTIGWSWWWVTSPLWIPIACVLGVFMLMGLMIGMVSLIELL